jgi:hypothetical protein
VSHTAKLKLALLKAAEGLRDEFEDGNLGIYIPLTMALRLRAIERACWDALGNPTALDVQTIKEKGK